MEKPPVNTINKVEAPEIEQFSLSGQEKNIQEVFKLSPELKEIGTVEQYAEYLKTIFPESEVQDIVWHGTKSAENFDKFDIEKESSFGFKKHGAIFFTSNIEDAKTRGSGNIKHQAEKIIPAVVDLKHPLISGKKHIRQEYDDVISENEKEIADILADDNIQTKWQEKKWKHRVEDGKLILEKIHEYDDLGLSNHENDYFYSLSHNAGFIGDINENQVIEWKDKGFDGIIDDTYIAKLSGLEGDKKWIAVFNTNQINILGSENDIEKFKKFVKKEKAKEDLKYEPLKYVLEIANVENAKQLVDKLSEFETKAGFEKVFERLENISNLEKIKVVFKDLNYLGDISPEKIQEGSLQGPIIAQYNEAKNTLYIDNVFANSGDIGDFYTTVLHELTHEVFKGADKASGLNIIYGLPNIKNTIEKLPVHNKYRNLYSLVLHNISKEMKDHHYGLSSVDEFISEAYSNPAFQNFLKKVELKNKKSISSKAIDLLLSVVTLNNRVSTHEISESDAFSAFQRIDLESLNLLEDFEKNMRNYFQK